MKCQLWQKVYGLYFLKGYFNQNLLKNSLILILILDNLQIYKFNSNRTSNCTKLSHHRVVFFLVLLIILIMIVI
jgi:hypothetical protein